MGSDYGNERGRVDPVPPTDWFARIQTYISLYVNAGPYAVLDSRKHESRILAS
jgi:hypothetical protein